MKDKIISCITKKDLKGYHTIIKNIDDNSGLIEIVKNELYKNTHIVFDSNHAD